MTASAGIPQGQPSRGLARIAWCGAILAGASLAVGATAGWLPLGTPYKRSLAAGMLRLVLLTLAAGCLAAWWTGRRGEGASVPRERALWVAVGAGMVAYAAGLSALSLVRHWALLTGVFDLGYNAQIAWGLAQLRVPVSTVQGNMPWGNHLTFMLAAAAPLLWVFPDPATLLVLQSVILALGAVPAFCLGRRAWGNPLAGAVVAGAYLLYPPLQFANLFDFRPDTFATPILLAAFAALFAGRTRWALAWAGLLVFVKEDMALVAVAFGLYVALAHGRRSGLLLAGGAAVGFVLLVWVLIPSWIGAPYFSVHNRWHHLGTTPWELIASPVLRPGAFFGTLLQAERLGYLVLLVTPLAGFPLLAPEILAVGLPSLASNLLSTTEMQYTLRGHYAATLTPILVSAAAVGSHRAAAWLERAGIHPRSVVAGLAATSVVASLGFSPMPWSLDAFARKQFWNAAPRPAIARIAAHVPPEASLSAANHVGAQFALRRAFYLFPHGHETADLVLVDVGGLGYVGAAPNAEVFRPLLSRLVESRSLVALEDGLALFGRGSPSPDTARRLHNLRPLVAPVARHAGHVSLVAASVSPGRAAPREWIRARYTWIRGAAAKGMPCVSEALVAPGGRAAWEGRRPLAHGLVAAAQWPVGWAADETVVAMVPETVPAGTYTWTVSTWYASNLDACSLRPDGVPRLPVAWVRILPW